MSLFVVANNFMDLVDFGVMVSLLVMQTTVLAPLGAADAEIRFLSAENPEMSKVSPSFIGGTGQNTGMHASSTAKCQIILVF